MPVRMLILTLCLVLGTPFPGQAELPEEKGLKIAVETDRRYDGFHDYAAETVMTLKNKQGETSIRHMHNSILEAPGDGDKSLVVFDQPRDVKGTALLNFSHKKGDDDQWLFLPALKRVKRISSSNKSGPFMGSEFAYEDITSQEVEKYTYKWIRDEACEGEPCFVIERYPVYENSGYTRQVVWIDQSEYRVRKIEYYDRKNDLLKTQTFKGYRKYLERFWYADEFYVINHQTGKSTLLEWKDRKFQTGMDEGDFNINSLQRAR